MVERVGMSGYLNVGPPALSKGVVAGPRQAEKADMRRAVGEFVGNAFYGTLIRQMQASSFKTKYLHGGRGEDVFQGQLGMELAQRMGRSLNNPVADRLFESIERRLDPSAEALPGRSGPGSETGA